MSNFRMTKQERYFVELRERQSEGKRLLPAEQDHLNDPQNAGYVENADNVIRAELTVHGCGTIEA